MNEVLQFIRLSGNAFLGVNFRIAAHCKRPGLIPGHFVFSHPEIGNFDFPLRTFVEIAVLLILGASHEEFSSFDGDHFVFDSGLRNLRLVVGVLAVTCRENVLPNAADQFPLVFWDDRKLRGVVS